MNNKRRFILMAVVLAAMLFAARAVINNLKGPEPDGLADPSAQNQLLSAGSSAKPESRDVDQAFVDKVVAVGRRKTSKERVLVLDELLNGVSSDLYAKILDAVLKTYGKDLRLLREIFDFWCRSDPAAAAKWVVKAMPGSKDGRLLAEKATQLWAEQDFDAAFAWMKTLPDAQKSKWSLALNALKQLASKEPAKALAYLDTVSEGKLQKYGRIEIFKKWLEADPKMAFETLGPLLSNTSEFYSGLEVWGKRQPEEVIDWAIKYANESGQFMPQLLSSAAVKNYGEFVSALYAHESYKAGDRQSKSAFNAIMRTWALEHPEQVSAWISAIAESDRQAIAQTSLRGELYSGEENKHEYKWKIPFAEVLADDEMRSRVLADVALEWAYDNPAEAEAWASGYDDPAMEESVGIAKVGLAAKANPTAAISMVNQFSTSESRRRAMNELIIGWSESDPSAATLWISKHQNDPADTGLLKYSYQKWAEVDSDAATAWLDGNSSLSQLATGSPGSNR